MIQPATAFRWVKVSSRYWVRWLGLRVGKHIFVILARLTNRGMYTAMADMFTMAFAEFVIASLCYNTATCLLLHPMNSD